MSSLATIPSVPAAKPITVESIKAGGVSIFDRIANADEAAKSLGRSICASKIFGCQNEDQGIVLAWEVFARRIPVLELAQSYHLMMGRLVMRADAMTANFIELGGTYEVHSCTPDLVHVTFRSGGRVVDMSLSWEKLQFEPWIYDAKEADAVTAIVGGSKSKLKLKPKYSTPESRCDMMWARVISRGVRRCDPRACCGRYTPEEIMDGDFVIEGVATPVVDVSAITAEEAIKQAEAAYAAQATVAPTLADKAPVATPATSTPPTASTAPTTPPPPPAAVADAHGHAAEPDAPGYATKLQRMELDRLWAACLIPPVAPEGQISQAAILRANYKVESQRSLTQEQATTLIGNLTKRAAKMAAETAASAANVSELDKFAVTMTKEQRAYAAERIEALRQKMGRPLTDAEELAEAKKVVEESNAKNSQRQALEALVATEAQCNLIRGLVRTVEQTEHGTMQRLVDLLRSKGISKFAELSQWSANRLIDALQTYQMEAFFTSSIENWRPVNAAQ